MATSLLVPVFKLELIGFDAYKFIMSTNIPNFEGISILPTERTKLEEIHQLISNGQRVKFWINDGDYNTIFNWNPQFAEEKDGQIKNIKRVVISINCDFHIFDDQHFEKLLEDLMLIPYKF